MLRSTWKGVLLAHQLSTPNEKVAVKLRPTGLSHYKRFEKSRGAMRGRILEVYESMKTLARQVLVLAREILPDELYSSSVEKKQRLSIHVTPIVCQSPA
ncbi:hypothetical protein O181_041549 [Austropuccinia psidii MF-1]|uniref:Uncharacterized protein n=1 Tax=Austropuccinia psidii MF-1 TaxID=1389203 RepID=A0A9Q3HGL1_9BASI|nr:hypothetical protein [Austropuccinia psidii MF-1]